MKDLKDRILKAILKGLNEALEIDDDELGGNIFPNREKRISQSYEDSIKEQIKWKKFSPEFCKTMIHLGYLYTPINKEDLKKTINDYISKFGNEVDLNWIDVSNITDMGDLFRLCKFNGDISNWNVSNVRNMQGVFDGALFNGDISKWDTSNVNNTSFMFDGALFKGDISNWNVSNVKDMCCMFRESLFNGDISNWNVSNVKDMQGMFRHSLFKGDISNWDVSSVTNMGGMFEDSKFNGDISNWDVSGVTGMDGMFYGSKFNGDISKWHFDSLDIANDMCDIKVAETINPANFPEITFKNTHLMKIAGDLRPEWMLKKYKHIFDQFDANIVAKSNKYKDELDAMMKKYPLIARYYDIDINRSGNVTLTIDNCTKVSIVLQNTNLYRVYLNSIWRFKNRHGDAYISEKLSTKKGLENRAAPYKTIENVATFEDCIEWLMTIPAFNMWWVEYDDPNGLL